MSCVVPGGGKERTAWSPAQLRCIAVPQHVFSRLLGKTNKHRKTGLLWTSQEPARDPALSNRAHSWGRFAWWCFLSPMARLAELVLVLIFFEKCQLVSASLQPGASGGSAWRGGGLHKPESRRPWCSPHPKGSLWKPNAPASALGKRLGQQSPLRPMTARPRLRQLEGGGDQFLLTDDHVARLVFSASEVCGGPTVHQVRPRQTMTYPRWHNTESVGWDQHPGTCHLEASCSPMLPQGTS